MLEKHEGKIKLNFLFQKKKIHLAFQTGLSVNANGFT